MPTRCLCVNRGHAQRSGATCRSCGFPTKAVDLPLPGSGVLMWVLATAGGVLFLVGLVGATMFRSDLLAILVFVSLFVLGGSLGASALSDSALDRKAREMAAAEAAGVPRCSRCQTALVMDPAAGRLFCPVCREYR